MTITKQVAVYVLMALAMSSATMAFHTDRSGKTTEGALRLVGSSEQGHGRLELYHENAWGTICDRGWSESDAEVACRQLGYTDVSLPLWFYGTGDGPVYLEHVSCVGSEDALYECPADWYPQDCDHYHDVGIQCATSRMEGIISEAVPVAPESAWLIGIIVVSSLLVVGTILFVVVVTQTKKATGETNKPNVPNAKDPTAATK